MGVFGDVEEHVVAPMGVVTVVEGSQIQVVSPADPSLARPCPLGEEQRIAAAVGSGDEGVFEALSAPPLCGHRNVGQVESGGRDVEVVVEPGIDPGLDSGPREDRRYVAGRFVGSLMVGVNPELAEGLAVIG